jgi:hypothetical protein
MTHHSHTGGFGSSDWLVGAVKKNPEGLLLLAAGCALLLRGAGQRPKSSSPQFAADAEWRSSSRHGSGAMSRGADSARQYASEVRDSVSEAASNYASAASDYVDDARRAVMDRSERFAERAQSRVQGTIDRVLQQQPLAVALAGLAVGAAVAAAFPATAIERRTLGPAGERLSDAAANAGKKVNEATAAAGERLKDAAEERGLSAEGLKEVAREVAGTVGETLAGEQNDQPGSSGREAARGQTSSARSAEADQSAHATLGGTRRPTQWEGS